MDRIERFRDARFGMFVTWGINTIMGFEASWPLVMGQISYDDYDALADRFNPQRYDPRAWAALAKAAGMRYAVLVAKHHDGFALWDTALGDYSAARRAAGRDLVRPYVEAFREAGLLVGLYFSLCDWHHPDYPVVTGGPYPFLKRPPQAVPLGAPQTIAEAPARWERYLTFMHGQVRELCTNFGQIDVIWFDGQWERSDEEWRARELVAMIRELQPMAVINNRLADPSLGDFDTPEGLVPVDVPDRPWETCMTMNDTWAFNPTDQNFKPAAELVADLAEIASKGGNFLLDVGPTADGEIAPPWASRLRVIGDWMARNGESIYARGMGLNPGAFYGPTTGGEDALYLHVLGRPVGGILRVRGLDRLVVGASLLDSGRPLEFHQNVGFYSNGLVRLTLPPELLDPIDTVVKLDLGERRDDTSPPDWITTS